MSRHAQNALTTAHRALMHPHVRIVQMDFILMEQTVCSVPTVVLFVPHFQPVRIALTDSTSNLLLAFRAQLTARFALQTQAVLNVPMATIWTQFHAFPAARIV